MTNIPFQLEISPALPAIPNVYGASDYREFRSVLIKIDNILIHSGLERQLINQEFNNWLSGHDQKDKRCCQKQQAFHRKVLRYALRCNIARHLTGESLRDFSIRLTDSNLFQWFVGISDFELCKASSKSSLDRYNKYFDAAILDEQIKNWLAGLSDLTKANNIGLNDAISFSSVFMDSTCIKANIHFPTDWILLRDAARSLILSIKTIRSQGLKHRMIEPAILMRLMNQLCIKMTHTRRRKDSKKKRKATLRQMKTLSRCIEKHAKRYKVMLQNHWEKTDWSLAEAQQVIRRIDNILDQLPNAIKQAHERIIGERQIASKDKILSLYEPDIHVIVRGKAGNEVEFGQGLLLCEQINGIIIDWQLFKNQPPSDSKILQDSVMRLEKNYGLLDSMCTDRGFDSKQNQTFIKERNIYNAVCPRNPKQLQESLQDSRFRLLQTRRGQTEARIGIFKNAFLGRPLKTKGFINKQLTVSWCVLTHNLWVVARMALADEQSILKKAA